MSGSDFYTPSTPRADRRVSGQNQRIGEQIDEMRVEVDINARAIAIFDCRPPWREDFGPEWTRHEVARLRYTKAAGTWTLYWPDRHSKFHRYQRVDPTPRVERLPAEIAVDPHLHLLGLKRVRPRVLERVDGDRLQAQGLAIPSTPPAFARRSASTTQAG